VFPKPLAKEVGVARDLRLHPEGVDAVVPGGRHAL
jgi:hypothetical protein